MKVAVVCPYDIGARGGVQAQVVGLARFLRSAGHDVWVVAPGSFVDPSVSVRSVGPSRPVKANDSVAPVAIDPRAFKRVRAALADADVAHIHEPFMPVVSWAALRCSAAQILTFHADPPRWAARAYGVGRRALRRPLIRAAAVTAVSPVAAAPVRRLGLDATIVPNAVSLPSATPDLAGRGQTVAFVGRNEERKGLDVLLAGWPRVLQLVPGAQLTVISPDVGPLDRGRGLPGVTFHTGLDDDDRDRVLGETAVFAAPNRRGESFGITVAEAMAQGCAVVASDIPAFRHVGGEVLTFVPAGDSTALADAVAGLLIDEPARIASGGRAAQAATQFSWQAVGDVYVEMYHNAVHS